MSPAHRRGRGRKAFTLVEVMISMSVLAFVLLAFLGVLFSADSLRTTSREESIALQDVQSALEYTFGAPYDKFKQNYPNGVVLAGQIAADGATVLPNFKDSPANPRPLKNEAVAVTWQAWDPNPEVDWVEYRVDATWTDHRGRPRLQSVVTRRSR